MVWIQEKEEKGGFVHSLDGNCLCMMSLVWYVVYDLGETIHILGWDSATKIPKNRDLNTNICANVSIAINWLIDFPSCECSHNELLIDW